MRMLEGLDNFGKDKITLIKNRIVTVVIYQEILIDWFNNVA